MPAEVQITELAVNRAKLERGCAEMAAERRPGHRLGGELLTSPREERVGACLPPDRNCIQGHSMGTVTGRGACGMGECSQLTCVEHYLYTCPYSMPFIKGGIANSIMGMQ